MSDLYPGIINTEINADDWTAIEIPSGAKGFSGFKAQTRDNSIFYVSDSDAGTNRWTAIVDFSDIITSPVGSPLFYVKGTSSTTLEVLLRK